MIAFDVNETLLDLRALDRQFEVLFGSAGCAPHETEDVSGPRATGNERSGPAGQTSLYVDSGFPFNDDAPEEIVERARSLGWSRPN